MKNSLFLHIGIHKTGTTLLQTHIFPKCQKILYLGRYHDNNKLNNEYFKTFNNLSLKNLSYFEIRKLKKIKRDILISNENILRPFSFDNNFFINNLDTLNDIFKLKILLTTRKVEELILSRFLHNQRSTSKLITADNLNSSVSERNCFAPFCTNMVLFNKFLFYLNKTNYLRKYKCVCKTKLKNINPKIYFKKFLEKKLLKYEFFFFDIVSNDRVQNKSELLRLKKLLKINSDEYLFSKTNENKIKISEDDKNNFLKTIISKLNDLNLN